MHAAYWRGSPDGTFKYVRCRHQRLPRPLLIGQVGEHNGRSIELAKKTVVRIFDDIDGAELDEYETVRWGIDGKLYEFDTSPEHAGDFRELLATYRSASRTVPSRGQARGGASVSTKALREWAIASGYTVSSRGRISAEIRTAYEESN